jgi:hypothetical protein
MYILNEKVRGVLSLAFQNFHTIFEELTNVHNHFQVDLKKKVFRNFFYLFKTELDRELMTLIDMLTVEIKTDVDKNQGKLIHIEEEETLIKVKACFQEMVDEISFDDTKTIFFCF